MKIASCRRLVEERQPIMVGWGDHGEEEGSVGRRLKRRLKRRLEGWLKGWLHKGLERRLERRWPEA